MEDQVGTIQLNGIKPSKSLLRYIERQVEKWIWREQSLLFLPRDFDYAVTLDREFIAAPYFQCSLDIRIGAKYWQAHEEGRSLQEVLQRAIRHLRQINTKPMRTERSSTPSFKPAIA